MPDIQQVLRTGDSSPIAKTQEPDPPSKFLIAWQEIVKSLGYLLIPICALIAIVTSEVLKAIVKLVVEGMNRSIKLEDRVDKAIAARNSKLERVAAERIDGGTNEVVPPPAHA